MSVFKTVGDFIHLNVSYCEFYIPTIYFDSSKRFAIDYGGTIEVFGLFNVGVFNNGKHVETKSMNIPTMITINVYDSEIREVKLTSGEVTQCKVIKYLKDAKIMSNVVFESFSMGKEYLKLLLSGNLPSIIPYSQHKKVWKKNQQLNSIHFGISDTYLETILSSVLRYKEDFSLKYSKVSNNPGITDYDYGSASIRQICQYNSTFTALTYEDMDSMITSSLNKSREKVKDRVSPVEQIIKF